MWNCYCKRAIVECLAHERNYTDNFYATDYMEEWSLSSVTVKIVPPLLTQLVLEYQLPSINSMSQLEGLSRGFGRALLIMPVPTNHGANHATFRSRAPERGTCSAPPDNVYCTGQPVLTTTRRPAAKSTNLFAVAP